LLIVFFLPLRTRVSKLCSDDSNKLGEAFSCFILRSQFAKHRTMTFKATELRSNHASRDTKRVHARKHILPFLACIALFRALLRPIWLVKRRQV
jgi:hypothetical protein